MIEQGPDKHVGICPDYRIRQIERDRAAEQNNADRFDISPPASPSAPSRPFHRKLEQDYCDCEYARVLRSHAEAGEDAREN